MAAEEPATLKAKAHREQLIKRSVYWLSRPMR